MKQIYLTVFFAIMASPLLMAQSTTEIISIGQSYDNPFFYNMNSGESTVITHEAWDIAFSVAPGGGSIFTNEGSKLGGFGQPPVPRLSSWFNAADDFDAADTTGMLEIYNPEISWAEGAFNSIADPTNPFDLGWGTYNPGNNTVAGDFVFFIQLRSGTWRKVQFQSLIDGVYSFRHANLDGSDLQEVTIDKADYPGKTLAYYSLENNEASDLEPENWDLFFTRYWELLPDDIQYQVTGVLPNQGVETVQVDGVDPMTATVQDYLDQFQDTVVNIGSDWKRFDFSSGWIIESNRVYFLKTAADSLWKIEFLDFAGSGSGDITWTKTYEGQIVNTEEIMAQSSELQLFPNPVQTNRPLSIQWPLSDVPATTTQLRVVNSLGQVLHQEWINVQSGLNQFELPTNFPAGQYWLEMNLGDRSVTKSFVIAQ
ncbi:MAG: T9SS type A sorting domain-containing protein [Bacteroidota bacterium]